MPDETRQPDPLEARARELAETFAAYVEFERVADLDSYVEGVESHILAALRTVQQETARATWERAIDFVQQLPRAEAVGVMSGMLDKTYGRTKPLSEIRELVACPACYGSGFVCDADGIEDNCSTCNTTGRVAATPTEDQR